jgi:hypothetical protein
MQDSKVAFYNSLDLLSTSFSNKFQEYKNIPGMQLLQIMTRSWTSTIFSMTDRTNSVSFPINSETLPFLKMPVYNGHFKEEFDTICQLRARYLLDQVIQKNRRLCVLYSGGVDSTLILISLLKVATEQELDTYVHVFLSEVSRGENPNFYENHLLPTFKNLWSSYRFHSELGNPNSLLVSGEGCDQLFGTSLFAELEEKYGRTVYEWPAREGRVISTLIAGTGSHNEMHPDSAELIYRFYEPMIKKCPVSIDTFYQYLWWLNFNLKWQSVYTRLSSHCSLENRSTLKYEDNFTMFFAPEEFQLWAMNNHTNFIQGSWRSYKYHLKDIIYDFTNDNDYRIKKVKYGSLFNILKAKGQSKIIDTNQNFYDHYPDFVFNRTSTLGSLESENYLLANNRSDSL